MTKKPSVHLIDPRYIEDLGRVLDNGKEKYPDTPWQQVKKDDNMASLLRHLLKIMKGEVYDEESGLQHAAHIGVRAMMLHHSMAATEKEEDKRKSKRDIMIQTVHKIDQRKEKRAALRQKIQGEVCKLFRLHNARVVEKVVIDDPSLDMLPSNPEEFMVTLNALNHPKGNWYTFEVRLLSRPRSIEAKAYVRIKEEEALMTVQELENEIKRISTNALETLTRHKYKVKEPRIVYTLPSYLKESEKDTPSISGIRIRSIDSDFVSSFDPPYYYPLEDEGTIKLMEEDDRNNVPMNERTYLKTHPLGFQSYYHIDLVLKVERVDKDPVFIEVDIKADIEKFL